MKPMTDKNAKPDPGYPLCSNCGADTRVLLFTADKSLLCGTCYDRARMAAEKCEQLNQAISKLKGSGS